MTIQEGVEKAYANAKSKGFHDEEHPTGVRIALIHSELSEALEADRDNNYFKNNPIFAYSKNILENATLTDEEWKEKFEDAVKNTFEDEIADAMIRCMDLAGQKGFDLEWHVRMKMVYNSMRPHKHGRAY